MGTVFTGMGTDLVYRKYQRPLCDFVEFEDNWLRITQQSHDLFCACGDWQVHFQFALQRKYSSQWCITHDTGSVGVVEDSGTSGGDHGTGDVDSDLELAAAAAAVEVDTAGPDDVALL